MRDSEGAARYNAGKPKLSIVFEGVKDMQTLGAVLPGAGARELHLASVTAAYLRRQSTAHSVFRAAVDLDGPGLLNNLAQVMEFGAKKYARSNWRKGLPVTTVCDSLLRHLVQHVGGEAVDTESALTHVAHVQTNALFLAYMSRPELDDRGEI